MHYAVSDKLRVVKSGDHAKHSLLLTIGEIGLKSHEIETIARHVFFAKLHHRIRFFARVGIAKSDGFERSETYCVAAAFCHLFDGHAPFKKFALLKIVQNHRLRIDKFVVKSLVFVLLHGQVEIVFSALAVSSAKVGFLHIYAVKFHNRRNRIVEKQPVFARELPHLFGKCVRG